MVGRSDANFTSHRSTTGKTVMYGGATVLHRARKQHCVSMSTCEAELIALADLALDLLYVQRVLEHLGVEFEMTPEAATADPEARALIDRVSTMTAGMPEAETDSKSAFDLCQRNSAGASTRHVERRVFKMRELVGARKVQLKLVTTAEMYADVLTKILDPIAFRKCRSVLMNLEAVGEI